MRRFVFAVLVVAMLVIPTTAFAQVPDRIMQLGDPIIMVYPGLFAPLVRADSHLTRVDTTLGYPWTPILGTWTMPKEQGEQRKLTRELVDPVTGDKLGSAVERSDVFGNWFKVMMLPRDEAFYPCSFPLKWKCNYVVAGPGGLPVIEWHSPVQMNYDPVLTFLGLNFWPFLLDSPFADPQDTIHPVFLDTFDFNPLGVTGWHENILVDGMLWKWSDPN